MDHMKPKDIKLDSLHFMIKVRAHNINILSCPNEHDIPDVRIAQHTSRHTHTQTQKTKPEMFGDFVRIAQHTGRHTQTQTQKTKPEKR